MSRFRYTKGRVQRANLKRTAYGTKVVSKRGSCESCNFDHECGSNYTCVGGGNNPEILTGCCRGKGISNRPSTYARGGVLPQRVGPVPPGGSGGNRSMHDHMYPNGPYGPSGHIIPRSDNQIPKLGWGWTNQQGEEILQEHFDPDVVSHWGQYSNPIGTPHGGSFTNELGQHVGYSHSSTTHSHDTDIAGPRPLRPPRRPLRKKPRPIGPGLPPPPQVPYYGRGGSVPSRRRPGLKEFKGGQGASMLIPQWLLTGANISMAQLEQMGQQMVMAVGKNIRCDQSFVTAVHRGNTRDVDRLYQHARRMAPLHSQWIERELGGNFMGIGPGAFFKLLLLAVVLWLCLK